ncbi:hypothetical protein HMPREF1143_0102 [Peptoanaerobacter stomatis]|uniref:Uncharacterized protein n=1 Tax=Peptoanaerobacter stomatis TaxID=796937 RepID=J4W2E5_9FIRM|nr:hypothetical protein [Peptoanaerobacter stomatis]EJU20376.1 hypothetical protein HMPREF1143_0102 [Peptoanaerobacter stomatis]
MKEILIMILCFITGYIVAVYINKKHIAKAKKDIMYVNTLKSKEYKRGYNCALTYRKGVGDGRG